VGFLCFNRRLPMPRPVREEYEDRRGRFAAEAARLGRLDGRIATLRGAIFLAGLGLAAVWLATGRPSPLSLLVPTAAFLVAIVWHAGVVRQRDRARRGVAFYDRGLDRLNGRAGDVGPDGGRYRDATHPYADDLDLFGPGSLFQTLWRGATRLGEDRLAAWLLNAADGDAVRGRQAAVEELRDRFDLRERIGLLNGVEGEGNQNLLRAWSGVPARPLSPVLRATTAAFAVLFWLGLGAWAFDAAPVSLPVAGYAACLVLTFLLRGRIAEAIGRLDRAEAGLAALADVLRIMEGETYTSPALQSVRRRLATEGVPCSRRIDELHRLSHFFDAVIYNQFAAPICISLGLPIFLVHSAELWRGRFGPAVPGWLDATGEFEALLSLSGYAVEHPDDPWPTVVAEGPLFAATRLGHPLLPDDKCIRNDVALGDPVRLLVVSGSNMAGKSTLLRAVGVNAVLAFAGAPVRAKSLTLSPLRLGSVIRVADSLQTGKSLFFTAIERLKRVTSLAGGQPPLLFLLDELLAGTNSHDRRIGAEAVLRRLVEEGAIGIVTTHDLALTEIADSLGTVATNAHFRDVLVGDRMRFDYTLRPGVVDRGNALALMRLVGLLPAVPPDQTTAPSTRSATEL
jgi:hypothetical protein